MSQEPSQLVVYGPIDPDVWQHALDSIPARSKETRRGHVDNAGTKLRALESAAHVKKSQNPLITSSQQLNFADPASTTTGNAKGVSKPIQKSSRGAHNCSPIYSTSSSSLIEPSTHRGGSHGAQSVRQTDELCDPNFNDDDDHISADSQHEILQYSHDSSSRSQVGVRKIVRYRARAKSLKDAHSSQGHPIKGRPSKAQRERRRLPPLRRLPLVPVGAQVALHVEWFDSAPFDFYC